MLSLDLELTEILQLNKQELYALYKMIRAETPKPTEEEQIEHGYKAKFDIHLYLNDRIKDNWKNLTMIIRGKPCPYEIFFKEIDQRETTMRTTIMKCCETKDIQEARQE